MYLNLQNFFLYFCNYLEGELFLLYLLCNLIICCCMFLMDILHFLNFLNFGSCKIFLTCSLFTLLSLMQIIPLYRAPSLCYLLCKSFHSTVHHRFVILYANHSTLPCTIALFQYTIAKYEKS